MKYSYLVIQESKLLSKLLDTKRERFVKIQKTRWEGQSNEIMYEICGMGSCTNEVNCGVVEWVKRNTLRYVSEIEDPMRREKPILKWKDRVKEYMHERGADRGLNREGVRG